MHPILSSSDHLRRLKCLTIRRCHSKGSKLSSVILRPWVLVQFKCGIWITNDVKPSCMTIFLVIMIPRETCQHGYRLIWLENWGKREGNFNPLWNLHKAVRFPVEVLQLGDCKGITMNSFLKKKFFTERYLDTLVSLKNRIS